MLIESALKVLFRRCQLCRSVRYRSSTVKNTAPAAAAAAAAASSSIYELVIAGDLDAVIARLHNDHEVVNVTDGRDWTPLMYAARLGHVHVVEAILKYASTRNLQQRNRLGFTAIELATMYERKDIYALLAKAGSNMPSTSVSTLMALDKSDLSLTREAGNHLTPDWLSETVLLPSSRFIVIRKGWPLVVTTKNVAVEGRQQSKTVRFLRLNYSEVSRFISDNNVIYLGRSQIRNASSADCRDGRSSKANGNDDVNSGSKPTASSKTDADVPGDNIFPKSSSTTSAYFCLDLSIVDDDEIINELGHGNEDVELIHPFTTLRLLGTDARLYCEAWPLIDWHQRNRFCPTCGSATKMAEGGFKRVCENTKCTTHKGIHNVSYPRVDPSVITAIGSLDGRRCLLVRKAAFPSGMHSCVAGFVEPGETMEAACVREAKEEVGVDVTNVRYQSSQSWPGPSVLMAGFIADGNDSQPISIDSQELETARWFDRSEAVAMLTHEHPSKLFVPPPEAIAHHLVKAWVLQTAAL